MERRKSGIRSQKRPGVQADAIMVQFKLTLTLNNCTIDLVRLSKVL